MSFELGEGKVQWRGILRKKEKAKENEEHQTKQQLKFLIQVPWQNELTFNYFVGAGLNTHMTKGRV